MAIQGSGALMPPGSPMIRAGQVRLTIGEPISTAGLGPADRDRMLKLVHARIAEMLGEPAAEQAAGSVNHAQ